MRETSLRYLTITVIGTIAVTVIASLFNLWVLPSVPYLKARVSPNEALFIEGLFVLILGVVIILGVPHMTHDVHTGIGAKDPESHKEVHFSGEVQALGFSSVVAFIVMLVMYFLRVY